MSGYTERGGGSMIRLIMTIMLLILGHSMALSQDEIVYQPLENSVNRPILESLDPELVITYAAPNEKYSVTIFTDIFCPYCRKLHQNMHDFLDNGITVHYVPFPLSRRSVPFLESIWCSPKEQQIFLLDTAMLQEKFRPQSCDFPVMAEAQKVAKELKVYGTPSIFLQDGRKVSGFMTAQEINDGLEGRLNFDEWRPKHLRK